VSTARLDRLFTLTADHDAELHAWIVDGVRDWRGGLSLDVALGLAGGRARRYRDQALRRAAEIIMARDDVGVWEAAGRLAKQIRHFERCVQPRMTEEKVLDPLHQAIADALHAGCAVVRSPRRLWEIIR
jgi:hypothetical protein